MAAALSVIAMSNVERQQWIEETKAQLLDDKKSSDRVTQELMSLYDEAAYKLEMSINALYKRFADDNGLSAEQANSLLTGKEYSTWRNSLKGYLDLIKRNPNSKTLIELNTLAMKSRITRKEQLLSEVYINMAQLADKSASKLTTLLRDVIKVHYNKAAYRLQKQIKLAFPVPHINETAIKQILDYPWQTKKFSETVWNNVDKLAAVAKRDIAAGMMMGSHSTKIAASIAKTMGTGKYVAERLARTETHYFAYQAKMKAWVASGITQYRFSGGAEGSGKCDCAALNGGVFDIEMAEVGVNYPPMHPNCRCAAVPHIEDGIFSDRFAVPMDKDMGYDDWKDKYLGRDRTIGEVNTNPMPVTSKSIRSVKPVNSRILDKKRQKMLAERNKELLEYIKDEPVGTEAIAYYDMNLKELAKRKGDIGHVGALKVKGEHIVIHNHPSGNTFTHTDIRSFVTNIETAMMVAVGNSGKVYTLEKGDDYDGFKINQLLTPILEKWEKKEYTVDTYMNDINQFLSEVKDYGAYFNG